MNETPSDRRRLALAEWLLEASVLLAVLPALDAAFQERGADHLAVVGLCALIAGLLLFGGVYLLKVRD